GDVDGEVYSVKSNGATSATELWSGVPDLEAGLVLSGATLYGVTSSGGDDEFGEIFKLGTNGIGLSAVHVFTGGDDGGYPYAGLIISGDRLYGTAYRSLGDGINPPGSIFSCNTNGDDFKTLHTFNETDGAAPQIGTLLLVGNTLYGTTAGGGVNEN